MRRREAIPPLLHSYLDARNECVGVRFRHPHDSVEQGHVHDVDSPPPRPDAPDWAIQFPGPQIVYTPRVHVDPPRVRRRRQESVHWRVADPEVEFVWCAFTVLGGGCGKLKLLAEIVVGRDRPSLGLELLRVYDASYSVTESPVQHERADGESAGAAGGVGEADVWCACSGGGQARKKTSCRPARYSIRPQTLP